MNVLLLRTLYFATLYHVIECQSSVKNDQPYDQMQYVSVLFSNVMQLLVRVVDKLDRQNEVIFHLNQTVERLHEKIDQESQLIASINNTLSQQQRSILDLTQFVGRLHGKIDQQSHDLAQFNRTLLQGQHTDDQISETLSQHNNAIIQMNENCARSGLLNTCVNQTLVYDGQVRELGRKIDQQSQLCWHLKEKFDQQSQLHDVNLHQTLRQQQTNLQQVASSILHLQEHAMMCSLISKPTVHNATARSVKQTSNETVITYSCNDGYAFSTGLTSRSTSCNGTYWTPIDDNCKPICRPVLTHVIKGDRHVYAMTSFNNQLFVTRESSPIAVYDTTTFARSNISVSGMSSASFGVVHCPTDGCLYVSDYHNEKVHKLKLSPTLDKNTKVTSTSWPVGLYPRGLSINRKQNLLVVLRESNKILEYTPSGSLVREISDRNYVYHAVEHVANGTFVVSRDSPVHGVALMSVDGRVIRSYGTTRQGLGPGQMNIPRSIAVNRYGYVLVADEHNDRILVLNPTLSDARPLPLSTDDIELPLNNPIGLWLDESRGRLYVGEYSEPYRVLVYDNVSDVGTLFVE